MHFGVGLVDFLLAFMPLYMLGFMGATRRLDHYEASTGWHPLFVIVGYWSSYHFLRSMHSSSLVCFRALKIARRIGIIQVILGMAEHWNGLFLPLLQSIILQLFPTVDQLDPYGQSNEGNFPALK